MSKNILVCGNGPSCQKIDYTRTPVDIKVMRVTNFFFEEKYYAGKRVDYYVDYAKRLDNQYFNIHTINEKNEYDINMQDLWWTVLFESNPHFPVIKSCTEFIQKQPMIAEFRCFYEYYYGQYLPTGMQALALAFCLGYDNIYIAGFDLFSDINNLHSYLEGNFTIETIKEYKSTSIYDTKVTASDSKQEIMKNIHKTHPIALQVKFVHLLENLFPETRILSVCNLSAINEHIKMAEKLYESPWYRPLEKSSDRTTDWYPLPDTMPSRQKS